MKVNNKIRNLKVIFSLLVLMIWSNNSFSQEATIRGKVKTADNFNAEQVKLSIKEIQKWTITNSDGEYEFENVPFGKYTIITNFSGSKAIEKIITVNSNQIYELDFQLSENIQELNEIVVFGGASNKFYIDSNQIVGKLPLKDIENPQVYQSIPKALLNEQVATDLQDALKNATGVTRLWESTGRGGDGAEYYSMRGFSVQPTLINGVPGINNGTIDPANIETVDVLKGPSGTLFGSPVISYGGLINITTKKPYERLGGSFGYIAGNFGLNRLTADVNIPLNSRVSVRLNTAYNTENSFQNAGNRKSLYFAPSFKLKASDKLTFYINTEFNNAKSVNTPMVFLNRYAPLTYSSIDLFEQNYENSYTSNDLVIENPTFSIQGQAIYEFNKKWSSQTIVSKSNAKNNGCYHYLWDASDGKSFDRFISKRNGETQTTDIQHNLIGNFNIGKMKNKFVFGLDFYQSAILNASTGWVGNGVVDLQSQTDTGVLTQIAVDSLLVGSSEGVSSATNQVLSSYISNVLEIHPKLSVVLSGRIDRFSGLTNYWSTDTVKSQIAFSPKLGIVYQPIKGKLSIFANYMHGFINQAPVQVSDTNGLNPRMKTLNPEQANQYEFGVKTNLWKNKLMFTGSYYNILVKNKVMNDPTNINNVIQGGEVISKGIELSLIANPLKGLNIIGGFSKNTAKVSKDDPTNGYLNMRPEEAGPSQLINYWISYTLKTTKLTGLGFGFGGNAASEHLTLNRSTTGTFTLPSYHIVNASLSYTQKNYTLILKGNNLANQKYYSGWSTVTAQQLRSVSLSFNYQF